MPETSADSSIQSLSPTLIMLSSSWLGYLCHPWFSSTSCVQSESRPIASIGLSMVVVANQSITWFFNPAMVTLKLVAKQSYRC